jgi:hypothetical protein
MRTDFVTSVHKVLLQSVQLDAHSYFVISFCFSYLFICLLRSYNLLKTYTNIILVAVFLLGPGSIPGQVMW